ncbi:MAG: substrate-binding domain-containing protein [Lachnospiraceae bacterium]|nr:substrate-binding domain-containing protein [Lachnospiraceae bacterium]
MTGYGETKKTIGLILEDISVDYSKEIIHSVRTAMAGHSDMRLVVLAGIHDEEKNRKDGNYWYKTVHNSVYHLEEMLNLDGLILTLPNICGVSGNDIVDERYKRFADVPKVFISTDVEDSTTVRYDNAQGLREAIDYLVNVKGITKLCMLGGRDDNGDAQERKRVFIECLRSNKLDYSENMYEKTDMSIESREAAVRLINRNPDVQAIFCVNDQVAVSLYDVLKERGIMPGRDVQVFGYDNTRFAGTMMPPLASIGADGITLGQKALELLLTKMAGETVESVVLPTRLYGRESLEYEMYEYTTMEMLQVDPAFIYRMFDDCFYRYASEIHDNDEVNLRRLFFEFISRMLRAMVTGSMTMEEFTELKRLIHIFFENGAMKYTDPARLVRSIERLQNGMNRSQKSVNPNLMNNRCFSYMKDRAILAMSEEINGIGENLKKGRERLQDFFVQCMAFDEAGTVDEEKIMRCCDRLGLPNIAVFLFEKPVDYRDGEPLEFPSVIRMMCSVRDNEIRILAPQRRLCQVSSILERTELPKCDSFAAIPIFYGCRIYGLLLSEMNEYTADRGNIVADQLGRTLRINEVGNDHFTENE